jgi:hypothetical protein
MCGSIVKNCDCRKAAERYKWPHENGKTRYGTLRAKSNHTANICIHRLIGPRGSQNLTDRADLNCPRTACASNRDSCNASRTCLEPLDKEWKLVFQGLGTAAGAGILRGAQRIGGRTLRGRLVSMLRNLAVYPGSTSTSHDQGNDVIPVMVALRVRHIRYQRR